MKRNTSFVYEVFVRFRDGESARGKFYWSTPEAASKKPQDEKSIKTATSKLYVSKIETLRKSWEFFCVDIKGTKKIICGHKTGDYCLTLQNV